MLIGSTSSSLSNATITPCPNAYSTTYLCCLYLPAKQGFPHPFPSRTTKAIKDIRMIPLGEEELFWIIISTQFKLCLPHLIKLNFQWFIDLSAFTRNDNNAFLLLYEFIFADDCSPNFEPKSYCRYSSFIYSSLLPMNGEG